MRGKWSFLCDLIEVVFVLLFAILIFGLCTLCLTWCLAQVICWLFIP